MRTHLTIGRDGVGPTLNARAKVRPKSQKLLLATWLSKSRRQAVYQQRASRLAGMLLDYSPTGC